jgi:hypothetical protein
MLYAKNLFTTVGNINHLGWIFYEIPLCEFGLRSHQFGLRVGLWGTFFHIQTSKKNSRYHISRSECHTFHYPKLSFYRSDHSCKNIKFPGNDHPMNMPSHAIFRHFLQSTVLPISLNFSCNYTLESLKQVWPIFYILPQIPRSNTTLNIAFFCITGLQFLEKSNFKKY